MTKTPALSRRHLLAAGAGVAAIGAAAPLISQPASREDGMKGKAVLITGCSSGFGYLSALNFARNGAKVIATMRNLPRPEAAELKALADAEKLDLHIVEIDVLSDDSVAKGVAEAERIAGGAINILVNNAGIGITGPVEVQDMEATRLIFDTNVFGYQRMARAVLPGMRAQKAGQIFLISSQLGRVVAPGAGHYCATKFACEAMGEQLAYELVPHGIEVTIIQPGGYPTDIWKKRNVYTRALRDRAAEVHKAGYPALVAQMGEEDGSGRTADPMDIPRAMAEIIAMPRGARPLRRAVHPGSKPQEPINQVSAEVQQRWLGPTPYGPWVRDVLS